MTENPTLRLNEPPVPNSELSIEDESGVEDELQDFSLENRLEFETNDDKELLDVVTDELVCDDESELDDIV